MNPTTKKKVAKKYLRNKQRLQAKKKRIEEKEKQAQAYKEDPSNTIRVFPKGTPLPALYYGTKEYAMKMKNDNHTKPISRLLLGEEYKNERVLVSAWVSDIRQFKNKGKKGYTTRILLIRPNIHRLRYKSAEHGRSFDSHVWIDVNDIGSTNKLNTLYMNVGDMTTFTATIYKYRGKIEHGKRGIKYGLTDIEDIISGYPFFHKISDGIEVEKIEHNYPRHKEWILKWKGPNSYKTQPTPDWLRQ